MGMAHAKEYPGCSTITESSMECHLQPSVENDAVCSSVSNGKPIDCARNSVGQLKILNGKHDGKVMDPNHKFFSHSSNGIGSNGEVHRVRGEQENLADRNINGSYSRDRTFLPNGTSNVNHDESEHHESNGITNGSGDLDEKLKTVQSSSVQSLESTEYHEPRVPKGSTYLRSSNGIVETDSLTSEVLSDLFNDKICVLCVKNYASRVVCEKLDSFLREKGSEEYTHEIRSNGRADLLYFGVNRFGYPLNSSYNDPTGNNLGRYLSEAMSTIRSIREASHPYLSPIDKFRVEMDEAWNKNVNVASLQGQKTFCGIGRIMPVSLSKLSEAQPHFDAVPTSYFPQIQKQFTANFYLNVPETGGELEIWNVPPISIDNIENFTVPEDWRGTLPASIKVKPDRGDLLMFNTRRPHAITSFGGSHPRTSVQTFVGLAKNSEVFLWV